MLLLYSGVLHRDMVLEKEEQIKTSIEELLNSIQIKETTKGRRYLISAIRRYYENPSKYHYSIYKGLYVEVAEENNTSFANVEKDIRKAIESAWTRGQPSIQYKLYGSIVKGTKPTAAAFIIKSAEIIKSRLG